MTIEGVFSRASARDGRLDPAARRPASPAGDADRGHVIPLTLAAIYLALFVLHGRESSGGFSSLAEWRSCSQSLAAAGRVGALPGLRSVHRRVGDADAFARHCRGYSLRRVSC